MRRIALVSNTAPANIGGVERFAFSMADHLARQKMMIDVYDRSSIEGWLINGTINIWSINTATCRSRKWQMKIGYQVEDN